ncbi:endonuclease/exonuclease/phosphatase family metal-dependent hydrolase [Haloferula luteola]|uniref:Endonuclease/exonuclease/phosphatase family metal-dependent hydrolase n=1 Tax=Haloferula luteola TaxID=595692 RepID=A0A840V638_9BACT|nr:endonuclease/exonuclease/phosphatase family protein [Haloferula luteola]MBB5353485.1 endonuclease/exonuclease/phosphatase family metal-dependent hydrolase [Haloferula luteola]
MIHSLFRSAIWVPVSGWCLVSAPLHADDEVVKVMTFNSWHQWSQIHDGFEKARAAILESQADVVSLQESTPEVSAKMAQVLGWYQAQGGSGSVQILSRHPMVQSITGFGIGTDRWLGARLRIDGDPARELLVFNLHLDYQYYGPYAARDLQASPAAILAENARSERLPQVKAVLESIRTDLEQTDRTPLILTGDFNVPSYLDWKGALHGGRTVDWPETHCFAAAGLMDSFRQVHPDPAVEPGTTWSAIHKDGEPQDRIDFILYKGPRLHPVASRTFTTLVETTLGPWGSELGEAVENTWPSDHAAVMTTFRLTSRESDEEAQESAPE